MKKKKKRVLIVELYTENALITGTVGTLSVQKLPSIR